MLPFFVRRLGSAMLLVFLVSSGAVLLTIAAPGDYTSELLVTGMSRAAIERERARLGLDAPMATQYAAWLGRAVRFDFGTSLLYRRPVGELVAERGANTAILAAAALVLATIIGLPLGVVAGSRERTVVGRSIRTASIVALSCPPLLTSLLIVFVAVRTGWLPATGHLAGPALALAIPVGALIEQVQSATMRDVVGQPFVGAARARGLSPARVLWVHALRSALVPVLAVYGLIIGGLLSGSFVVELVAGWPGLGRLTYEALRARDTYLVAGAAVAGAVCLAVGTLVSDLAQSVADPRLRAPARGGRRQEKAGRDLSPKPAA